MTTFSQPRGIDYSRAARIALALIDQDVPRMNTVLAECQSEGTVHLLIAALAQLMISVMAMPAKTPHEVRAAFEGMVAVEQLGQKSEGLE